MKKLFLLIVGALAAFGSGYIIYKKLSQTNPDTVAAVKESCNENLHKASVFCAGKIKLGGEKLSNSVSSIIDTGKKKSRELINSAKAKSESFKNEIDELKEMMSDDDFDDVNEAFENSMIFEDAANGEAADELL